MDNYDKIAGGVAQDLMLLLPTRLLIHNHFDILQFGPQAQAPVLAIIGAQDAVVRSRRSEALLTAWPREIRVTLLEDGNHFIIYALETSWEAVRNFFSDLLTEKGN